MDGSGTDIFPEKQEGTGESLQMVTAAIIFGSLPRENPGPSHWRLGLAGL
jgi:hypothetical protein